MTVHGHVEWLRCRIGALFVALTAALLLAACGSAASTAVSRSSVLRTDTGARIVHLLLAAGSNGADGGFNFDGYGNGAMRVSVPVGWTVEVECTNDSSVLTHSCAIVENSVLSPNGAPIAFPGATTPDPTSGLSPGTSAHFSFVASRVGTYRIACLVSGHALDGSWDWFRVTAGGRPAFQT